MRHTPTNHDSRYFPEFDFASPLPREHAGAAFDLIERSVGLGASVIAIGPYTNLAAFEVMRPGLLDSVPVTVMGGHVGAPPLGYPQWGANMDYNVQADRVAARIVFERLNPLIVPLRTCFEVTLRRVDIPALEVGGRLARLIALQGQLQCAANGFERLTRDNPSLPPDMLNFHWDPCACGAALRWECFETAEVALDLMEEADGSLAFEEREGAPKRQIVANVDAERFRAMWLERVLRV
jgi:inosine-uridine nucleoside N-ribohydrolase